jgi:hypothetical protein
MNAAMTFSGERNLNFYKLTFEQFKAIFTDRPRIFTAKIFLKRFKFIFISFFQLGFFPKIRGGGGQSYGSDCELWSQCASLLCVMNICD